MEAEFYSVHQIYKYLLTAAQKGSLKESQYTFLCSVATESESSCIMKCQRSAFLYLMYCKFFQFFCIFVLQKMPAFRAAQNDENLKVNQNKYSDVILSAR